MPNLENISKVFAIVPDSMLLVDVQGNIVHANPHTYGLFNYPPESLTGCPIDMLIPERYRASHGGHLAKYFASPSVRSMGSGLELSARKSDGSEFSVEISLSPFRTVESMYAVAAIRDITERKHLEANRRENERQREIAEERARAAEVVAERNERLRVIFNASPAGIITATGEGKIDQWNRAAERIYGYTASEMVGMSVHDFLDKTKLGKDGSESHTILAEVESGREVRNLQLKQREKEGRIIDVNLSLALFRSQNEAHSGFVFLINDVSELRAIEHQLRQSQKMEAIGQLTGGIAHDFNNLLSIVICNLELLQERLPKDSEDLEMADMALEASLRGADLIKQIMAFSRKQNLDPQMIEVNALVKNMTNLLTRTLGEQIEIVLEMAPDVWSAVADPVQLQTALANLATNARDAMPKGGQLVIQTGNASLDQVYVQQFTELNAGDYVMVSVTDSGTGMSPETIDRAFDPFFTTKPTGEGTGLGLSMVFGFVKQSGGHVRIYSEEGYGTTVRLYLPRVMESREDVQSSQASLKELRGTKAKILIVEDNLSLAKSAYRVLTDAGFEAVMAANAEEALNLLGADTTIDLLFTDIILTRGNNGIELAQAAMEIRPEIKILFSSGFSEVALRASGKAVVADRFIAKPYRREDLIAKINSLIEQE